MKMKPSHAVAILVRKYDNHGPKGLTRGEYSILAKAAMLRPDLRVKHGLDALMETCPFLDTKGFFATCSA
jgi:hypothetical protein